MLNPDNLDNPNPTEGEPINTAGNDTKTQQPQTSGQQGNNGVDLYRLAVKYTPFNKDDPEIWFVQLETQFLLGGITSDAARYGHLVAALDEETIKYVRDELLNPSQAAKYMTLKKCIIDRMVDSQSTKLNKLLVGLALGDKKPSQLLRQMQSLAEGQLNDQALQSLWMQRLPQNMQEILSSIDVVDSKQLAKSADKIHEVYRASNINTVTNNNQTNRHLTEPTPSTSLEARIMELSSRLDDLVKSKNDHWKPRSPTPSGSRKRNNSGNYQKERSKKDQQRYKHCWYHFKYGEKAEKCVKPCAFITPTGNIRPA